MFGCCFFIIGLNSCQSITLGEFRRKGYSFESFGGYFRGGEVERGRGGVQYLEEIGCESLVEQGLGFLDLGFVRVGIIVVRLQVVEGFIYRI